MNTEKKVAVDKEMRLIPVNEIVPDPNQPRKTFYKMSMEELVASVKANKERGGVLQSLLLRKHGDKYMIIFGERRWRAATIADIKELPCIITEATDEEALQIQLIENLQRENLIPLEQAMSFRQLAEKCKMNVQEIALQMGKSEHFVRQQMKLTELLPQWQNILNKNGITLSAALQICVLPEASQKHLYQSQVTKEDEKAKNPIIQINDYTLNQYKCLLSEANFDITDPNLDKKIGACTGCPFNTASNSLFPGEEQTPRCNNVVCFKNKMAIHQKNEFQKAKNDPTVMLVYEGHSLPEYVKKIKSEGNEVLKLGYSDDCKELKEPQKPVWKEFEKWAKRQGQSEKDIKKNFKKEQEDYDFRKEVFDKNVATGKYKKAFIVDDQYGRNMGKYVFVEINSKNAKATDFQKMASDGNATTQDIDKEIDRLLTREIRAKELDAEKVHEKIVQVLKECKAFYVPPKTSNRIDTALINFLLLESVGFSNRSVVEKFIKQPGSSNLNQFYKWLESLSRPQVSFLIRQIILDKYGSSLPNTRGGFLLRKMVEGLGDIPIAKFEKDQKVIAEKRQQRINERIAELKKQKVQLSNSKKPQANTKESEKNKAIAA